MIRQASRDRDHLLPQAAGQWRGARHHVAHHVAARSEEHTSELQSQSNLVCRLLLEKKKNKPPAVINYLLPVCTGRYAGRSTTAAHARVAATPLRVDHLLSEFHS